MKCAGNLGEGAVIFNKSGVGIREDSSIYKCTCSVMYLWFCSLCSFLVLFFFLNISFLKGHLSLPKMSYIWKNLYIKLKLFFFLLILIGNICCLWLTVPICSSGGISCWVLWDMIWWLVSLCYLHITTVIWTWTFFTLTSVVYC